VSEIQFRINDCYIPYLKEDTRIKLFRGAVGSGKSVFLCQNLIIKCLERRRFRALVARKIDSSIRNSVFNEFGSVLADSGVSNMFKVTKSPLEIFCKETESVIYFKGIDDPEKIKSISRPNLIWMEEATEFEYDDFKELNARMRGKSEWNYEMWLSFNSVNPSKCKWIRELWDKPPQNAKKVLTTMNDNKFLDEEYIKQFEYYKERDNAYYRYAVFGDWLEDPEGLVYPKYKTYAPDDFNENDVTDHFYGLDFGWNEPSALVECWVIGSDIYVKELIYAKNLNVDTLALLMKNHSLSIVAPIYADTADPEKINRLRNAGFNVQKANKGRVEHGIQTVKQYSLYIYKYSQNIINEIEKYRWKESKNTASDGSTIALDMPIQIDDHAMDAMRYAIHTHCNKQPLGIY